MEKNAAMFTEKYEQLRKKYEILQNELSSVQQSGSPEKEHDESDETIQSSCLQLDSESIVEQFKNIFTNQWPDAFEEGKRLFHPKDDNIVGEKLLKVLDEIIKFCRQECQSQLITLKQVLQRKSKTKPPQQIELALKRLQETTMNWTVDLISQIFDKDIGLQRCLRLLNTEFRIDYDVRKLGEYIRPFVNECIRVGWLMNLLEPRIVIKQVMKQNVSLRIDENLYERWQSIGDLVEFVAWPALMDENGTVVAKGFVKCFNPDMNLQQ